MTPRSSAGEEPRAAPGAQRGSRALQGGRRPSEQPALITDPWDGRCEPGTVGRGGAGRFCCSISMSGGGDRASSSAGVEGGASGVIRGCPHGPSAGAVPARHGDTEGPAVPSGESGGSGGGGGEVVTPVESPL